MEPLLRIGPIPMINKWFSVHTREWERKGNPGLEQVYCVLSKKAGMPERKYMLHSSEKCFGKRSNQQSIKEGLGGALGNRADAVKQYKKSEHKWKKYLKLLKKQNKMVYSIAKKSGSRLELKKINNINTKVSMKSSYYSSDSSRIDLDSDSSLSSYSDWEQYRQPIECK